MLQQRIDTLESEKSNLQLELTSVGKELETAQQDVKQYSEEATKTQELYQHELIQHSKSVQSLVDIRDKVHVHVHVYGIHFTYRCMYT